MPTEKQKRNARIAYGVGTIGVIGLAFWWLKSYLKWGFSKTPAPKKMQMAALPAIGQEQQEQQQQEGQ